MIRGFVLGKFMPLHNGHKHMLDVASANCDMLTILVCSIQSEPIPGKLRYEWVKHEYPHARVIWCNEELPQEPRDEHDEEFWRIWRGIVKKYHPERVHRVFGSEDYVVRLAKEAGNAEPWIVDKARENVRVSGTAVRSKPYENWDFIPDVVKPYYTKRVLITGPESCGKTTISRELAAMFHTNWTPEYAREYIEDEMNNDMANLNAHHMNVFCERHYEQENYAWRNANKVTFSDTSALETYIYSRTMLDAEEAGRVRAKDYLDNGRYDFVILLKPDIPWEEEEQRTYRDRRDEMYELFKQTLEEFQYTYVEAGGIGQERLETCASLVRSMMAE
ncbi:AAA family ATPase [Fictibacillus iocasae]|uniref:AAA family ATPase n=1 Tax=Fictibacillus iocasae TaxID=2715437 RepID=A0ABW2NQZ5_9BACL